MAYFFYVVAILAVVACVVSAMLIVSDIQIIIAAVFGLAALTAFGFGQLLSKQKTNNAT